MNLTYQRMAFAVLASSNFVSHLFIVLLHVLVSSNYIYRDVEKNFCINQIFRKERTSKLTLIGNCCSIYGNRLHHLDIVDNRTEFPMKRPLWREISASIALVKMFQNKRTIKKREKIEKRTGRTQL